MTENKKTQNRVALEVLVKLAKARKCAITQMKSGWLRVEAGTERRLYIPTQNTVDRVDLAGFEGEEPEGTSLYREPADRPSGAVSGSLFLASLADPVAAFQEALGRLTAPSTYVPRRARGGARKVDIAALLAE